MTQSYPPKYPSRFYEWTSWAVLRECDKECQEPKQDASLWLTTLMNHFSLQMAHSSPGCSSCHSGLSKTFIIFMFFFVFILVLWAMNVKTSHVETWITGGHCCYMLMALERHFPRGCSWSLTWTTLLSLPSCHRRRKKRHPRNHLRRRRKKKRTSNSQRMLPHSTYWLTVNQNWAVSPTPVPPHDHCSRQSPLCQKKG